MSKKMEKTDGEKKTHEEEKIRNEKEENHRKGGGEGGGGRGLGCSCTVNNIPLGRDRLAHPYYPVTIYLLFVPYFRFVATLAIGRQCLPSWWRGGNLPQNLSLPPSIPFISSTSTSIRKFKSRSSFRSLGKRNRKRLN